VLSRPSSTRLASLQDRARAGHADQAPRPVEGSLTIAWHCILLAAFCAVLAVTTSASAECAWVLWTQSTGYPSPSREWEVQAAFPAPSDCLKMIDEREVLARKQGGWTAVTRNSSTDLFLRAGTSMTSFKCLPDTVDPRGPTGK
jgi:hypothetical protein